MRSRAARLIFGALVLMASGAAGSFLFHTERQIAGLRASTRRFDVGAREATDALAELRAAQQAYVAAGQGVAFWMPKVSSMSGAASGAIALLESSARDPQARTALASAAASLTDFSGADQRARDYIAAGQQLMSGDVIFTEGAGAATAAVRQVEAARLAEHQAADSEEAALRKQDALALGGAATVAILASLMLVPVPRQSTAEPETVTHAPEAVHEELRLRDTTPTVAPAPYVTSRPAGPVLRAAADLCTDFGRVSDLDELRLLVGKAADVMDASGLVVWMGGPSASELLPALAHGYAPQVIAKMPTLPRSADNAAAAAYRTGKMQIVLARPGSSSGAVVAPILTSDGCIGALSAEIRGGGETSDSVQALAAIFAAHLAGVVATTTQEAPQKRVVEAR